MPRDGHAQPPSDDQEPPLPVDPLDDWYRTALAETMRCCPEQPRTVLGLDEIEQAAARRRRDGLADFFGDNPIDHRPRQRPLRAA